MKKEPGKRQSLRLMAFALRVRVRMEKKSPKTFNFNAS
jgi:hypothetical protein